MLWTDQSVLSENKNFIFAINSGFNVENVELTYNEEDVLLYGKNKSVKLV